MNKFIGVYGTGGFGREVIPIIKSMTSLKGAKIVFIDDNPTKLQINNYDVLTFDQFLQIKIDNKEIVVTISNSEIRKELEKKILKNNIGILSVISNDAIIMDEVNIRKGAIICPNVILTSNIKIGKSFHANIYSYVAHDCIIGDYVTFAPRVSCNGNVHIESGVYIGTGAIIKQGNPKNPLVVGKDSIIGMGAVVTKSVDPNSTVIGNPAKPLVK